MSWLREFNQSAHLYILHDKGDLKDQFITNSNEIVCAPFCKNKILCQLKIIYNLVKTIRQGHYQIVQFYHYGSVAKYWIPILILTNAKVAYFLGNQGHNRSFLQFKYIKIIVKYIDLVIVNSLSICQAFGIKKESTRVFHLKNVLDKRVINSVPRNEKNIHNNLINIGIVGRLDPIKRHDIFLDIAKLLVGHHYNVKFSIIGNGTQFNKINKLIKNLNLSDCVTIYTSNNDLYDIYEAIDIFMLTSDSEGFSNAIMEAMIFGIPCVVTNVGGNSDIVKNNVNGFLFPKGDVKQGYSIISKLIDDSELYNKISQNAYDTIRDEYHPDIIIGELLDKYNEII